MEACGGGVVVCGGVWRCVCVCVCVCCWAPVLAYISGVGANVVNTAKSYCHSAPWWTSNNDGNGLSGKGGNKTPVFGKGKGELWTINNAKLYRCKNSLHFENI